MKTITFDQLQECQDRVLMLDVRTPAEFQTEHISGALLFPLDGIDSDSADFIKKDGRPCVTICRSGNRAGKAAEKLASIGVADVSVLGGGLNAWIAAGLPVARGRKTMSLERQVRIAAGTFVLIGILLAYLIHPLFILLSAFVGAGLIFAGVTDTCGMGMLLAKMPWNQCGGGGDTTGACCLRK